MQDTIAPTVIVTENPVRAVAFDTQDIQVHYPAPVVTDACDSSVTVICNPPSGSLFPFGLTAVTCETADASGNFSAVFFDVIVDDTNGIPFEVEERAPNNGDGNYDGIPDSKQNYVTSLPNIVDGRYVTIEAPSYTYFESVTAIENPSPDDVPAFVDFPLGFFEYTIQGVPEGGAITVKYNLLKDVSINKFYKYGPTPKKPFDHWYKFKYDGHTGAEITGNIITLHFEDGLEGDKDITANGAIQDPGAPADQLFIETALDIMPGACPNPVNAKCHGITPVAVLGTSEIDVSKIDPSTLLLSGIAPVRFSYEDTGTPAEPFTRQPVHFFLQQVFHVHQSQRDQIFDHGYLTAHSKVGVLFRR